MPPHLALLSTPQLLQSGFYPIIALLIDTSGAKILSFSFWSSPQYQTLQPLSSPPALKIIFLWHDCLSSLDCKVQSFNYFLTNIIFWSLLSLQFYLLGRTLLFIRYWENSLFPMLFILHCCSKRHPQLVPLQVCSQGTMPGRHWHFQAAQILGHKNHWQTSERLKLKSGKFSSLHPHLTIQHYLIPIQLTLPQEHSDLIFLSLAAEGILCKFILRSGVWQGASLTMVLFVCLFCFLKTYLMNHIQTLYTGKTLP